MKIISYSVIKSSYVNLLVVAQIITVTFQIFCNLSEPCHRLSLCEPLEKHHIVILLDHKVQL